MKIKNHPELRDGEVFIGNVSPVVFPDMKRWKTKRQGRVAYNDDGSTIPGKAPVFVTKKELEEAGIQLEK